MAFAISADAPASAFTAQASRDNEAEVVQECRTTSPVMEAASGVTRLPRGCMARMEERDTRQNSCDRHRKEGELWDEDNVREGDAR
ncbi:hypothetical protein ACIPVB_02460 [Microbacterium sp. NPDC090007]|uniref:hypothetical protein n=1 Tax=Microbacterium sp. NPDC090007 TaxID=3364204 RepID=UPI0037FAC19C